MRPEEVSKIRQGLEAPWDELREQRVLSRIQELRLRGDARPRRRMMALVGGGSVLVAAAAAFVIYQHRAAPVGVAPLAAASSAAIAPPPSPPADDGTATEQRLALADGSEAVLIRHAAVRVQQQRADLVHIAQQSGEVRYEVRPDPSREFVVYAGGATVRVRGTIFTVTMGSDDVEVRVQRGKVEVDDGHRARDLVVGEALRIPAQPPAMEDETADAPDASAPPRASNPRAGFDALIARADVAREKKKWGDAAFALEKLVALYPGDPRTPSALFTLGKVERERGHLDASARAFDRCWRSSPGGPLAQDALAEGARSWGSAGASGPAAADAQRYLERWPSGMHAAQMRAIAGP